MSLEPLTIFLYSKYSPNCKKLNMLISESGINIPLTPLCIDSTAIREKIRQNKQLDIQAVPSILRFFPTGSVEKYEGDHAFNWVETILSQYQPQPPPQPPQQLQPRPLPLQPIVEPELEMESGPPQQTVKTQTRPRPEKRQEAFPEQEVIPREQLQPTLRKIPARMKPIQEDDNNSGATSISDIPFTDEDQSDRHRNVVQPKRLQQADGQYVEDDELFPGDQVDFRREPANVVKPSSARNINGNNSIMAKAKELEHAYLQTQQETGDQKHRPPESRRP